MTPAELGRLAKAGCTCSHHQTGDENFFWQCAFHRACSPEVVLGMIARIKELERAQRKQPEWLSQAMNEGDGSYKP